MDGEGDGEFDDDGLTLREADDDWLIDGETEGLTDGETLGETLGETDGLADGETDRDGDDEGEIDGLTLGETDADGDPAAGVFSAVAIMIHCSLAPRLKVAVFPLAAAATIASSTEK